MSQQSADPRFTEIALQGEEKKSPEDKSAPASAVVVSTYTLRGDPKRTQVGSHNSSARIFFSRLIRFHRLSVHPVSANRPLR